MDEYVARFDQEWKHGDKATAREMAKVYVEGHRANLMANLTTAVRKVREAHLDDPPSIPDLVSLVDAYRKKGWEEDRIIVDMVLLAGYEPQKVTGELRLSGLVTAEVLAQAAEIVAGKE